jgi:3-keto-disaccharide hydrolase
MKRFGSLLLVVLSTIDFAASQSGGRSEGWISLFDGKSLAGWKASDKEGTFSVQDGTIVVHGPRSHLYYVGPVENHDFKNFEFKADVMTTPGSNSGIYFHTAYQEQGWPDKGFEVQVNNSHTDWKRTGGLYDIKDVSEVPAKDNQWFTERIIVQGKRIQTFVDDKLTVDYTEPPNVTPPANHPGRKLSSGTFALQGHDPKSKVFYKNIMVRVLRD